jgi:CyaY protein
VTDKEFQTLADAALQRVVEALIDVDDLGVDDMHDTIRIEFPDRRKLIMNRHTAAKQIWLAAPTGAWHFAPDATGATWTDVRTGAELHAQLEQLIQAMLGRSVKIAH